MAARPAGTVGSGSVNLVGMAVADEDREEELKARLEEKRFEALLAACKSGQVQLLVDSHFHNTGKSPAYNAGENLVPLLVLVMFSLTIMLFQGMLIGTGVLVVAMLAYVFGVRPWVTGQVEKRVIMAALEDLKAWRSYWKIGGIAISITGRPDLGVAAPKGDWKAFVQLHVGEPQSQTQAAPARPAENVLSPFSAELRPKAAKKPSGGGAAAP